MSKSFSYSYDPSASARDFVRWRISDTDCNDVLLYDEEIDGLVSLYGSQERAAAAAARSVSQAFARKVDITMGKLSIKHSQRARQFADLAQEIESEGGLKVAGPWAASISRDRKRQERSDDDRVRPAFAVGMHDTTEWQDGEHSLVNSTEGDTWRP